MLPAAAGWSSSATSSGAAAWERTRARLAASCGLTASRMWSWASPPEQIAALAVVLLGITYALLPEGRWRQRGKVVAAGDVASVAVADMYLGVRAPTDVLVGAAVGVSGAQGEDVLLQAMEQAKADKT